MAWNDLANNQMVSFTDAQGSGFTLNSGQSHVTSNECLTKAQALAKYNLDASAMSAYANNQLVPKSTWIGMTTLPYSYTIYYEYTGGGTLYNGFDLTSQACSLTTNSVTVYSSSSTITSGAELFLDLYGNTPILCIVYGGGRQYYKINGNLVRFSPDPGQSFGNTIYDVTSCVTGNSFTFGTVDSGSSAGACAGANTGRTLYSASSTLSVGTHLYTDSALTNSFIPGDGTQSYYLHSGSNSYRVTQSGIIDLITACTTGVSFSRDSIGYPTRILSCDNANLDSTFYGTDNQFVVGSTVYTNSGLTSTFNGLNQWWAVTNGDGSAGTVAESINIGTNGVITARRAC